MNRRLRVLLALTLFCGLMQRGAEAQVAGIPLAVKSAGAIGAAEEGAIGTFIAEQVKKLPAEGGDSAAQKAARTALIESVRGSGANAPSAAFLDAYAAELNKAMLAAGSPLASTNLKTKLTAAIVVAEVARSSPNAKLEKSVLALLADGQPEVIQLWGIKSLMSAAGSDGLGLLPALVGVKGQKPVLDRVVALAKSKLSSAFAQDAYDALRVSEKSVVGGVMAILQSRLAQYEGKGLIPEDPSLDANAITFFARADVWGNASLVAAADQVAILSDACRLMTYAAARADDPNATADQREQCTAAVQKVGQALVVMGQVSAQPPVTAAATPLMNARSPLSKSVQTVITAVRAAQPWTGVSAPDVSKLTPLPAPVVPPAPPAPPAGK